MNPQPYSTYLLLDVSLMGEVPNAPWMRDRRCRGWMERIYERRAASVSPVLIDIDAAYRSNRLTEVLGFLSACHPKFHASFLDSCLSLPELAAHLRQLTYFVNEDAEEFTLRFADGAVLPALAAVLTDEQWAAMHSGVIRWRVHNIENRSVTLPTPGSKTPAGLPLTLTKVQMTNLIEEMAVHQLLANVRRCGDGAPLAITAAREYGLAKAARQTWLASGQTGRATLLLFVREVLETDGWILQLRNMGELLREPDPSKRIAAIKKMALAHRTSA